MCVGGWGHQSDLNVKSLCRLLGRVHRVGTHAKRIDAIILCSLRNWLGRARSFCPVKLDHEKAHSFWKIRFNVFAPFLIVLVRFILWLNKWAIELNSIVLLVKNKTFICVDRRLFLKGKRGKNVNFCGEEKQSRQRIENDFQFCET